MEPANRKVVIFDDDEDILSLCNFILAEAGWEVMSFPDCKNILEKVTFINPAVILMDNWIPESGGVIATHLLKNSPALKHIPVIYFSANNDIEALALQAGAEAYLAKPFELEELEEMVAKYSCLSA